MFNNSYIKVTKENWVKIEELFAQKNKTIKEHEKLIQEQKQIITEMTETIQKLMKYKEKDDLLFNYENQVKSDAKKIKELNQKVANLEDTLIIAENKVNAVLSLENAYLKKIIHVESNVRKTQNSCPEYETKGNQLLEIYA
jgi:septal ring factor EnvC (AmiA/AmiB activator)